MTKQEFLNELKQSLSGNVKPEVMMDTYRYYADYIDEQVRSGKTEKEVLSELGNPSLIVRSIIAAQEGDRKADVEYTEDGKTRKVWDNEFQTIKTKVYEKKKEFQFDPSAWYAKVLYGLIVILMIVLVFCIIKGVFWLFIRIGIPLLLVLGIVYLVMYFLNGK